MAVAVPRELFYQILEYPIVTYITLMPRTLILTDSVNLPFSFENIELITDERTLREKLSLLGISTAVSNNFNENVLILATNLSILDLKYRTIKITAVADRKTNMIQLLAVRKSYFYNNRLYINAFDLQGKLVQIPTRIYQLS